MRIQIYQGIIGYICPQIMQQVDHSRWIKIPMISYRINISGVNGWNTVSDINISDIWPSVDQYGTLMLGLFEDGNFSSTSAYMVIDNVTFSGTESAVPNPGSSMAFGFGTGRYVGIAPEA